MRLPREFGKSEAGNQECKHRPGMTTIPKFPDFSAGGAGGGVQGFYPDPDAAPRALFPLSREGWRLRNTKTHSRPGFGIGICPSGYQGAAPSRSTWIPHSRSSGSAELRAPENWSKKKKLEAEFQPLPHWQPLKENSLNTRNFGMSFPWNSLPHVTPQVPPVGQTSLESHLEFSMDQPGMAFPGCRKIRSFPGQIPAPEDLWDAPNPWSTQPHLHSL